jgi:hypothetical protein
VFDAYCTNVMRIVVHGNHSVGINCSLQNDTLGYLMTCMILTGMGPVVELHTAAAKIFSSIYALYSGVAFLRITAVFFAPIIHRLLHVLHVVDDEEEKL